MRFVSWNIRGNTGVGRARRSKIIRAIEQHAPDVVALQEVPADDFREQLASAFAADGLEFVGTGDVARGYGNVILSRWPLRELSPGWFSGPRPDAVTGRLVESPDGEFIALSVHVPNGSGNGWVKIETFEALAQSVHGMEWPIVMGGDFNEPKVVLADGTVIPFMMKQDSDGAWQMRGYRTRNGRKFPRARWVRSVRAVLGREPSVLLVHAFRNQHGQGASHVTHVVRGKERFFDHVLVSPEWRIREVGYDDRCRLDRTSDHSLAWVVVRR